MFESKRILAVVPARGGSKGIPLKNLRKIKDKSLVQITSECISSCKYIDEAVISSDYNEIINEGISFGLQGYFKRPSKISGDNVGDVPVLKHALLEAEKQKKIKFDIIVMLQPTCPLRKASQVNEVIEKIVSYNFDTVWTVNEVNVKFHPDKQLKILEDGNLRFFSDKGKNIITRQELKKTYMKNGIAYAISRDWLLDKHLLLGEKAGYIVYNNPVVNIDDLQDLKLAETLIT